MAVAIKANTMVCDSALRKEGSFKMDPFGSQVYQRSENPCHTLRERPALKEKSTAIATGTKAQSR